ncbi:immunity 22 family protein [Fluviicola chungangensis]|uniref:Immunity protein 22 n=1 Tax=Fluviicola chungangensis TaxID=2597671 RepID=A0A556N3A8_9FLAO|nr:immunity 22 family protein [Fluviicola chungangensis]TSJ46641.1 hypothetical protein FO442_05640 [Fluviicola chungangensis]
MFYQEDYEKDFEASGKVSIWACKFDSEKALKAYMKEKQTRDDDIYSDFYLEFRMGFLDYDLIDFIIHEDQPSSLEELFAQVSYSKTIVENIKKSSLTLDINKYNSVICVFDYDFIPDTDYVRKNKNVDYIGSFDYDQNSEKI